MTEGNELLDYRPWLTQGTIWPRTGVEAPHGGHMIEDRAIEEMSPQHAIAAYRKLQRWTTNGSVVSGSVPHWNNVRKSILARELLTQAVGEEVVYAFELVAEEGRRKAAVESLDAAQKRASARAEEIRALKDELGTAQEALAERDDAKVGLELASGIRVTVTLESPTPGWKREECC